MAGPRLATSAESHVLRLENEAHALASALPELLVEARRVAATVAHGIHGRRRAGPGETFWQFRHFQDSDTASQVDWRRSAGSDHLFVREREWEAAHTVWLWPDLSTSMDFQSRLAPVPKRTRALVLMFALGELLVRGGERIGLLGLMPPTGHRKAIQRLAQAMVEHHGAAAPAQSLPPRAVLSRYSECVLFSDFLEPIEAMGARIEAIAAQGVRGHLVQILDPAEETLPYEGRAEFLSPEGRERMLANRVESLRGAYRRRLEAHRRALADRCRRLEWSFLVHHTDRPAEEALLALHTRLSGLLDDWRFAHPRQKEGERELQSPSERGQPERGEAP